MDDSHISRYQSSVQRGVWLSLHTLAKEVDAHPEDDSFKKIYAHFFLKICSAMGCSCESHCIEMLTNGELSLNKISPAPDGYFKHCFNCHDAVNVRLKKNRPTYEEVRAAYYSTNVDIIKPCDAKKEEPKKSIDEIKRIFPNLIGNGKKFTLVNTS